MLFFGSPPSPLVSPRISGTCRAVCGEYACVLLWSTSSLPKDNGSNGASQRLVSTRLDMVLSPLYVPKIWLPPALDSSRAIMGLHLVSSASSPWLSRCLSFPLNVPLLFMGKYYVIRSSGVSGGWSLLLPSPSPDLSPRWDSSLLASLSHYASSMMAMALFCPLLIFCWCVHCWYSSVELVAV
jgi:hypothetical protein